MFTLYRRKSSTISQLPFRVTGKSIDRIAADVQFNFGTVRVHSPGLLERVCGPEQVSPYRGFAAAGRQRSFASH